MTNESRMKALEEQAKRSEISLVALQEQMHSIDARLQKEREEREASNEMLKSIHQMMQKQAEIDKGKTIADTVPPSVATAINPISILETQGTSSNPNPLSHNSFGSLNLTPEISFPRFDGSHPRLWARKCRKFFNLHQTSEDMKVAIATLHFEGKGDVWFQDYQEGKGQIQWEELLLDLQLRFQDAGHDNIVGEFNKLKQDGSVLEYQEKFEELKALMVVKTPGLTEDYFISSFLSGLRDDISMVIEMFSPKTLIQTFRLARKQESVLSASAKPFNSPLPPKQLSHQTTFFKPTHTSPQKFPTHITRPPNNPKFSTNQTSQRTSNQWPKRPISQPQIKRLTYSEMRARREKGLCYNCDEVFKPGHKCATQQLYMLVTEEESSEPYEEEIEEISADIDCLETSSDVEISVHALSGNITPNTIRIKGMAKKNSLNILIDSGSTHSFIDPEAARASGCTIDSTAHLIVAVADGNKLVSTAKCPDFKWTMQGHSFQNDLRVLALGGCDMVLGVDWMRELSPVLFDFKKLQLTFSYNGKKTILKGGTEEGLLKSMTGQALQKLLRKGSKSLIGHLFSVTAETETQDRRANEKIDSSKQRGGLYYLDNSFPKTDGKRSFLYVDDGGLQNQRQIWLWHRCLGHHSFSYLRKLFPSSLFIGVDISVFNCSTCVFG